MFVSTAEAAQRLGLHLRTVQVKLREGTIPECCYHQPSTGSPYRVNTRALDFFEEHSCWPRDQREFSRWLRSQRVKETVSAA